MKKAAIGLMALLCLFDSPPAFAANGGIAWSMTRDAHAAAKRLEARKRAREAEKLAREACGDARGQVAVDCRAGIALKPAPKI